MFDSDRLEKIRKEKNVTQYKMSEILKITPKTYQNLLKTGEFRVSHLEKIAEYFKIPIIELFGGSESQNVVELKEKITGLEIALDSFETVEALKKREKIEYLDFREFINFIEWLDVADIKKVKKIIENRLNYDIEISSGIKIIDLQKYFATFENRHDVTESIYHCIDVDEYMKSHLSKNFSEDHNKKFKSYINKLKEKRES